MRRWRSTGGQEDLVTAHVAVGRGGGDCWGCVGDRADRLGGGERFAEVELDFGEIAG